MARVKFRDQLAYFPHGLICEVNHSGRCRILFLYPSDSWYIIILASLSATIEPNPYSPVVMSLIYEISGIGKDFKS